ncbi:Flagellin FlgL [Syntrophus gentianae]|uniref:Flagellin FlgL n=1 Tax=Syntrophus gentianae TaxID=43775 RepID=A0A1H7Z8I4_9BACT|nr:FlgD immunoglobulin-like domain containing protein [Syntrophus gentianae]SEM54575.1 Flagellin FlgL [Syntrophus gentianae]
MRITRSMMVNNMLHWTEQQMDKLNDISNIVASGKQINKPSDDPTTTGQILSDRATLSLYGQYESNISQSKTWIKTSSATLETASSFLEEAQGIMSTLTTADQKTKEGYLDVLEDLYDQVVDLANSKYGAGFMYSGSLSNTQPFSADFSTTVTAGSGEDLVFDLADAASNVTIEIIDSTNTVVQTITPSQAWVKGKNTVSWTPDTGLDGDYSFRVSATDGVGDAVAAYASYSGDDQEKAVMVGEGSTFSLNSNGGSIFSNALSTLSQAITAANEAIKDPDYEVDLGDAFDLAFSTLEAEEVSLSNTNLQLEYKSDRLEQLMTNANDRISDTEVGSTEEAAIKLQTQQTSYDVTLEAVASVLKMTKLSDLL